MAQQKPHADVTCPYTGHKKKCAKLYENCPKWVHIRGINNNTGEDLDEARCSDDWMVFLTINNTQAQKEIGAAIESFRNEMVNGNQTFISGFNNLVKSH